VLAALAADIADVIGPAVDTPEARRRIGAAQLYVSHLAAADALGAEVRAAAVADASALTGERVDDEHAAAAAVAALARRPDAPLDALVAWSWREAHRLVALWPLAAGRAFGEPTAIPTPGGRQS
jgi:hypothetical protein